jgi:hypothetical protein
VLNPFTGEETQIPLTMPAPYTKNYGKDRDLVFTSVAPSLAELAYYDHETSGRVVLWDLIAQKELASLPYLVPEDPDAPSVTDAEFGWSPDGARFATVSPIPSSGTSESGTSAEVLFVMNTDGAIDQITHLGDQFGFVKFSDLRWSPDNAHIAMWLQTSADSHAKVADLEQRLTVVDPETNDLVDYCLAFGEKEFSYSFHGVVWSPSGEQLVATVRTDDGGFRATLVDFRKGLATPIPNISEPVYGWLAR